MRPTLIDTPRRYLTWLVRFERASAERHDAADQILISRAQRYRDTLNLTFDRARSAGAPSSAPLAPEALSAYKPGVPRYPFLNEPSFSPRHGTSVQPELPFLLYELYAQEYAIHDFLLRLVWRLCCARRRRPC